MGPDERSIRREGFVKERLQQVIPIVMDGFFCGVFVGFKESFDSRGASGAGRSAGREQMLGIEDDV